MFCVPANKVWKIETVDLPTGDGFISLATNNHHNYGTLNQAETIRLVWQSASGKVYSNFPIWLESNFCGEFYYYSASNSNSTLLTGLISIIEFNVVP
jgi:hypothetical protein